MARKIQAIILMRDRNVKRFSRDSNQNFFIFEAGVYMVPANLVKINEDTGVPVLIYFEGNPTPIGEPLTTGDKKGKMLDLSGDYLDNLIDLNFLAQIEASPVSGGSPFAFLKVFTDNPAYMIFLILALTVGWALWQSGGAI